MSLAETREFHEAFGHPAPEEATFIPVERFNLRMELIREELDETLRDFMNGDLVKTADGLGDLDVVANGALLEFGVPISEMASAEEGEYYNPEDFTIDECPEVPTLCSTIEMIDSWVKITGQIQEAKNAYAQGLYSETTEAIMGIKHLSNLTAISMGIPLEEVCTAIHKANMSKLGEDGKPIYRESDNKILKGPNFRPPEEDIAAILKEHGAEL